MKVGICGHYGKNKPFFDGQTVKTKIITSQIEKEIGKENVLCVDTYGGKKKLILHLCGIVHILKECNHVIILPAQNGLLIFAPVMAILNLIFKKKLHYVVIGGWLPSYIQKRKWLQRALKRFDYIYVETNTMRELLQRIGMDNIVLLPNSKQLRIVDSESLVNWTKGPYSLCTFSRITQQKGIEDIITAVIKINTKYNRTVFKLDNYGQIDSNYERRFKALIEQSPEYIKYCGVVDFDKSVDVLKRYYALVFPTLFYTEGIPGTIIDAYAAGLPIISSKWESFVDIVDNGKTGIGYTFGNYEDLVFTLEEISNEPEILNSMRLNCVEKAKEYLPEKALVPLLKRITNVE